MARLCRWTISTPAIAGRRPGPGSIRSGRQQCSRAGAGHRRSLAPRHRACSCSRAGGWCERDAGHRGAGRWSAGRWGWRALRRSGRSGRWGCRSVAFRCAPVAGVCTWCGGVSSGFRGRSAPRVGVCTWCGCGIGRIVARSPRAGCKPPHQVQSGRPGGAASPCAGCKPPHQVQSGRPGGAASPLARAVNTTPEAGSRCFVCRAGGR
jgi:hypothetical protein